MNWVLVIAIVLICIGLLLFIPRKPKRNPVVAKRILTEHEQKMFTLLQTALPQHIILAQVAFSAFMTADGFASRSVFNRKMADFVILNQQFDVIAIIELDDASHIGREHIDAERDALIRQAGYAILRYAQLPDVRQIRDDVKRLK
ncbi:MAG: DUF2726 domain-containing protein [Acinetobacter sp.]|nr:DUF2726 domain-containing protein [Acinetobacter sp.]